MCASCVCPAGAVVVSLSKELHLVIAPVYHVPGISWGSKCQTDHVSLKWLRSGWDYESPYHHPLGMARSSV